MVEAHNGRRPVRAGSSDCPQECYRARLRHPDVSETSGIFVCSCAYCAEFFTTIGRNVLIAPPALFPTTTSSMYACMAKELCCASK